MYGITLLISFDSQSSLPLPIGKDEEIEQTGRKYLIGFLL